MTIISSKSFHEQTEGIAEILKSSWGSDRVTINYCRDGVCVNTLGRIRYIWDRFVHGKTYDEENLETGRYLFKNFGTERVISIFRKCGIDIQGCFRDGFRKWHIERLFVHLGEVYHEDLVRIHQDITQGDLSNLHISPEKLSLLQREFTGKSFEELDANAIKTLYSIASPFRKIDTYFLNNAPDIGTGYLFPSQLDNVRLRVLYTEHFLKGKVVTRLDPALFDYYKLKSMVGVETKEGRVIPDLNGFRYVAGKFRGKMNCLLMKPVAANKSEQFLNQVLMLPTQAGELETWKEDFRPEIGALGVMERHNEFNQILRNPQAGFIDQIGEKVDCAGYSLGVGHAQRLMVLFSDAIRKATFICGPKVDAHTVADMASLRNPMDIEIINNDGDRISGLGDFYLGHGNPNAKIRARILQEGESHLRASDYIRQERAKSEKETSFLKNLIRIPFSLATDHTANRLLAPKITIHEIDGENLSLVTKGVSNWENCRRRVFGEIFRDSAFAFYSFMRKNITPFFEGRVLRLSA